MILISICGIHRMFLHTLGTISWKIHLFPPKYPYSSQAQPPLRNAMPQDKHPSWMTGTLTQVTDCVINCPIWQLLSFLLQVCQTSRHSLPPAWLRSPSSWLSSWLSLVSGENSNSIKHSITTTLPYATGARPLFTGVAAIQFSTNAYISHKGGLLAWCFN